MASKKRKGRLVESEADVQARIVSFLEAHGWFCFQNRSYGLGGKIAAFATTEQSGSPDIFAWGKPDLMKSWEQMPPSFGPRHIAIEVKRPGGKQSDAQIAWAGRFCATGHTYILADSHEVVEKALRERGWL